tara:strand:- start:452 stop:1279 length:828 start_codon:yes stop_codon:yes gene_type:complete
MSKALVIGNGESRAWFNPSPRSRILDNSVVTWGCNAIYRDGYVHNLVAVDYAMQQEIYDSGYCLDDLKYGNTKVVHFANWTPLPADVADVMFMGYDIPEAFIHKSRNRTDQCIISGKDPLTLQERIEFAIEMNPNLDMKDLKQKMEKDVGIWITYVEPNDNIVSINLSHTVGWSAGNTALHLACQTQPEKVYILGFDLSSYDASLNNVYKGTNNYLSAGAKGFNSVNWYNQMKIVFREFLLYGTKFYLVDSEVKFDDNNVSYITKNELCEELKIV